VYYILIHKSAKLFRILRKLRQTESTH